jgi:hypothetical protein
LGGRVVLEWLGRYFFRLWTALVVLGGYAYLWLHKPEYLTWWKRTITSSIEAGCSLIPYPWGDRIESTLGNFGIWIELTVAILIFRCIVGAVALGFRARSRRVSHRPNP